jgi:hypothetical protein
MIPTISRERVVSNDPKLIKALAKLHNANNKLLLIGADVANLERELSKRRLELDEAEANREVVYNDVLSKWPDNFYAPMILELDDDDYGSGHNLAVFNLRQHNDGIKAVKAIDCILTTSNKSGD